MAKRKRSQDEESERYNPTPEATPPPVEAEAAAPAEDAPRDGRVYGRRNGSWVVLTMKTIMMQRPAVQKKSPVPGDGNGAE